jgi:hypothetical protein
MQCFADFLIEEGSVIIRLNRYSAISLPLAQPSPCDFSDQQTPLTLARAHISEPVRKALCEVRA